MAERVAALRALRPDSPERVGRPLPAEVDYEMKRLSNPRKGLSGTLYCGLGPQALYRELLPKEEAKAEVAYIAVERVLGTFEEDEGILLRGIVEAPAGPPEFHLLKGSPPTSPRWGGKEWPRGCSWALTTRG